MMGEVLISKLQLSQISFNTVVTLMCLCLLMALSSEEASSNEHKGKMEIY